MKNDLKNTLILLKYFKQCLKLNQLVLTFSLKYQMEFQLEVTQNDNPVNSDLQLYLISYYHKSFNNLVTKFYKNDSKCPLVTLALYPYSF